MSVQPYQFYRTFRRCPSCGARLLTATPLTVRFTKGLLQNLGITCYCVRCNTRYRATSRLRFWWVAWAGPIGRWLWWQTTSLEVTLLAKTQETLPKNG
ncbi:MAG: hypothetical protein HY211_02590 [Candidatus Omnitrophica bacterium]|nr:hypothetical protein [Candidatus Omnitrophota bacterium]